MSNMQKMYLVQERYQGDEDFGSRFESADKIIHMISMSDCCDLEYRFFSIQEFGKVEPLDVHGTWHNTNDPLYIKLTDSKGNVIVSGYGVDH